MNTADGQENFLDKVEEAMKEAHKIPWPVADMAVFRKRVIAKLASEIPWPIDDESVFKEQLTGFMKEPNKKTIKSDGSFSSYYDYKHPDYEKIQNVGDFMLYALYNDFDLASICKAEKRIAENMNGTPKEGSSIEYDLNKIEYHVGVLRKRFCK